MQKLHLPPFETKVRTLNGKRQIFDDIRKKWVALTPEEWVRQHFVFFLQSQCGVPAALIAVERGLHYNRLAKRCDIIAFSRSMRPWMIVECKAPHIAISPDTFYQAAAYDKALDAQYLALTNGIHHYCCRKESNGSITALPSFPGFEG